jgi:Protein of unknown function (DUF3429)
MNPIQTRTARYLTFAGLIPFAAGLFGQIGLPAVLPWQAWTIAYGAVIAAFIAGIHWAVFLFRSEHSPVNLLLTSNVLALAAWAALLLPSGPWPFRCLLLVFVALVLIDRRLHKAGVIPDWFYKLRLQASTAVSLCLLAMAVAVM